MSAISDSLDYRQEVGVEMNSEKESGKEPRVEECLVGVSDLGWFREIQVKLERRRREEQTRFMSDV